MATFRITGPDGSAYNINAPDGTEPDEVLRVFQSQQTPAQPSMKDLGAAAMGGGAPGAIMGAIKGKQDPAFKDVGTVYDQFSDGYGATASKFGDKDLTGPTATAAMAGAGDEAMGDIIQKRLGESFVRREKDANGYEMIVSRGEDGQEQRGYVNKPGLDTQDVWRTIYGATPYLAVGGGIGAATGKAAGWLGNTAKAGLQGLGAMATSGAGDAVTSAQGSEQGLDVPKMLVAGGAGAAAELASPLATGLARWWRGAKPHLDDAGGLTAEAAAKAKAAGLDPASLDPAAAEQFAIGLNKGADPKEIASMIQTNRFGIPTTKATRTKDPELSAVEKDIRAGNLGQDAKAVMSEFDQTQRREIQGSALQRPTFDDQTALRRAGNKPGDPYKEGMGAMVAPTRTAVSPDDVAPGTLARSIQDNLKGVRDRGDEAISGAFEPVTDVTPKPAAFQSLPVALRDELGDIRITDQTHPVATQMVKSLEGYAKGNAMLGNQADDFLGQTPVRTIVEQQRNLLAMREGATNNADRSAARAVYNGYNNWIDEIAEQGLVNGDAAGATALRTARQVTREVKSLFDPRGKDISPAAGRILKEIVERDNNADNIISKLFSGPTTPPKEGSIDALRQIRRALFKPLQSTGKALADPMEAARTWNDLRMAYWSRLVVDNKGQMASPTVAANNIGAALRNQQGVLGALFEPKEIGIIQQYVAALKEAAFRDPNPSGTATALRSLMRNDGGGWMKSILEAQSNRELFSKHNVFMSRFYRVLAKKMPVDAFGTKNAAGAKAARDAVDQNFTPKPVRSLGPFGSAAGANHRENDR